MWIPTILLVVVAVTSSEILSSPTSCHLSLKESGVSLLDFYDDPSTPLSLPLYRFKGNWDGAKSSDSCVVLLKDCVTCNCAQSKTPLLVQAHGWNMSCIEVHESVTAVDQRTIAGRGENKDQSNPVRSDSRSLTGIVPTKSLVNLLTAQNAAPVFKPAVISHEAVKPIENSQPEQITQQVKSKPRDEDNEESTTTKPKHRDAYDEMKILEAIGKYIDLVNEAPEARLLDKNRTDDGTTENVIDTTSTDATGTTDSITESIDETTQSATKKEPSEDVQSDDYDDLFKPDSKYDGLYDRVSTWRNKYFVVLGFFICFLIIFVIVIAILCIKLKNAQSGVNLGNVSPGPGCDTEPLTPQVQGGNFKFDDDGSLPR